MKEEQLQSREHTARRNQLLNTAAGLFMEKGYDTTSIREIIDSVGVAKGTFYHYFSSKEDLLNELILTQAREAIDRIIPLIDQEDLGPAEKFNKLHQQIGVWKLGNKEVIFAAARTLYRDENILYMRKLTRTSIELMIGPYTRIIREGIEEGIFSTRYPRETAEIILSASQSWGDVIIPIMLEAFDDPEKKEELKRKLYAFQETVEKILGARKGVIELYPPNLIDSFFEDKDSGYRESAHTGENNGRN